MNDAIKELGINARKASTELLGSDIQLKNRALLFMADELEKSKDEIFAANKIDMEEGRKSGLSSSMLDRLELNEQRLNSMIVSLQEISSLDDPLDKEFSSIKRPNGITIKKVPVPLGVVAFVYESRPNVTVDAAALCLKSSNAVILRGGKEAIHSNKAITKALLKAVNDAKLPESIIQLVQTTERSDVTELVKLDGLVDVVIPRGGEGLINAVTKAATVPVLKHYKGLCHVYVDKSAKMEMAEKILLNAKCQRPGVCNAVETLLVHEEVAREMITILSSLLPGVELRGDEKARKFAAELKEATEEDWSTEYLDLILSIKVVRNLKEAIEHINHYGSRHTECIVTEDESAAKEFLTKVDASTVCHNASTRFADGGVFGLGAEIGISTDKLHARGPMGVSELTTYKYLVLGEGQVRE